MSTEKEKRNRTDGKNEHTSNAPTTITHNVTELLDQLIDQATALVGKPVAFFNKDEKIKLLQYLNDSGALLITKYGAKL